jgi:hypothetical protein
MAGYYIKARANRIIPVRPELFYGKAIWDWGIRYENVI